MIKLAKPAAELLQTPYWILFHTNKTAKSFLDKFNESRTGKRGSATDSEQDLLRAMVTMTCAGLDSMLKHLVAEGLPTLIDCSDNAAKEARDFAKRRLTKKEFDHDFLATVLFSGSPRDFLVTALIEDLQSRSLQSSREIFRIAAHLGLEKSIINSKYKKQLDEVFSVRNKIIHELDIDFSQTNRSRYQRKRDDMMALSCVILECGNYMLAEIDAMVTAEE